MKREIHLSAFVIENTTVTALERLGFKRDEFANNTRCDRTEYHGTFRGLESEIDDQLWNQLCGLLKADPLFTGTLEEEQFNASGIVYFDGSGESLCVTLPSMKIVQPVGTISKACDIHINVNLALSSVEAISCLENLEISSFERNELGMIHRIFTITCESCEDGELLFSALQRRLGRCAGLVGKMKLEKTEKIFRRPMDVHTLPMTMSSSVHEWVGKTNE